MTGPVFSEAIKVKEGIFYNLPFHQDRMNRTTRHFFGTEIELNLTPEQIPAGQRTGLYKCRVIYSDRILGIEFIPYSPRVIRSMAFVRDDTAEYPYKFTDRDRLNFLLKESGCDEIILVKKGYVTDSSSSNLVFKDETGFYTPFSFLLPGTQRARLLEEGVISEREIPLDEVSRYSEVYLINAMIDLEDRVSFPVREIVLSCTTQN